MKKLFLHAMFLMLFFGFSVKSIKCGRDDYEGTAVTKEQILSIMGLDKNANYYQVLGVSRDALPAVIRKAYMKKMMKYHPDRAEEKDRPLYSEITKFIGDIHGTLKDDLKRQRYNERLERAEKRKQEEERIRNEQRIRKEQRAFLKKFETHFKSFSSESGHLKVIFEKMKHAFAKQKFNMILGEANKLAKDIEERIKASEDPKIQIQKTIELLNIEKGKHPIYMDINIINDAINRIAGQPDEGLKDEYLGELYPWRVYLLEYRDAQAGKLARWNELIKLINQVNDEYTRNIHNLGAINLNNVQRVIDVIEREQNWYFKQLLEEHLKRFKVLRDYLRKMQGSGAKIFI